MTQFALILFLGLAGCTGLAHKMNQPSAEQTAQADADQSSACMSGVRQIEQSFCDHPPKPVPQAWIDSFIASRNAEAPTCKRNPEQMRELDACLADLKAKQ